MSRIRNDADLHHADGTHRTTPASTRGRILERFEKRIQAHLAEHRENDARETET